VKRGPIVIAGTVAGLVAVLEFHTTPAKLTIASGATLPSSSIQPSSGTLPSSATGGAGGAGSSQQTSRAGAGKRAARTVTGPAVNYNFGVLSVKITVTKGKITRIGIAYLNDGGNPRSQSIDQQSIPILEQQALQAQSASIQGVSGASYTSAGFAQSLQSALHSLGM
jgi:uncharacterized protein with FMN-binding domain